jgi:hypothetical protein
MCIINVNIMGSQYVYVHSICWLDLLIDLMMTV